VICCVTLEGSISCRYFSCAFYADGQLVGTAYALNKKEAKTKAAAEALKHMLFRELVCNSSVRNAT